MRVRADDQGAVEEAVELLPRGLWHVHVGRRSAANEVPQLVERVLRRDRCPRRDNRAVSEQVRHLTGEGNAPLLPARASIRGSLTFESSTHIGGKRLADGRFDDIE